MEYEISQKAQDLINRVQDFIDKEVAHNETLDFIAFYKIHDPICAPLCNNVDHKLDHP